MARKIKTLEVKKVADLNLLDSQTSVSETVKVKEVNAVNAPVQDVEWEANQVNTESTTHLEDDSGHGDPVILRMFEFGANPQVFREHPPTKQDLFNSHLKGIEHMLWVDGMKVFDKVEPRIIINSRKTKYRIFIAATPARGHLLREQPKTLSQISNGRS